MEPNEPQEICVTELRPGDRIEGYDSPVAFIAMQVTFQGFNLHPMIFEPTDRVRVFREPENRKG